MDTYIFVLSERERNIWENNLGCLIEENGGTYRTFDSPEAAADYLSDPQLDTTEMREVITGSFGAKIDGPWRRVYQAANNRGIKTTLLTSIGFGINQESVIQLQLEGVDVIDKPNFSDERFIAERFPRNGPKQEIR